VAAAFFGRYEHSLDVKGRVILPVRFRPTFGPQAYLSQYQDRCLALWPTDEFEKQMAEMTLLQEQGDPERNLARIWAAGLAEVDIDRWSCGLRPNGTCGWSRPPTSTPKMEPGPR
jgi:MraZ protein